MDEDTVVIDDSPAIAWLYIHKTTGEQRVTLTDKPWSRDGKKWPKNWHEFKLIKGEQTWHAPQ